MISRTHIIAWQEHTPWISDEQIEQDLILSRVIVEIFSDPLLKKELAFRGGTALHKLFFKYPLRYSDDIDLVRTNTGPIGKIVDTLREKIDPWLGIPTYKRNAGRFTLYYKFETEIPPVTQMRVKIEINTRECFTLYGIKQKRFVMDNPWFAGSADVTTYEFEELLATKLRALYQRRKVRDLFDLAVALKTNPKIDIDKIVKCFEFYLKKENNKISAKLFMANLVEKLENPVFINDIKPLLARSGFPVKFPVKLYPDYNIQLAAKLVQEKIIEKLK